MSKGKTKYMLGVGLMAALLAGSAYAQTGGQNVDWPVYLGDISGSKFKPLDQINASNFSNLEVAWRFKTDNMGNRPEFKLEGTPLEVNGVVYATAGSRRAVVALDAVTGELLWVHGEKEGARGGGGGGGGGGRGG
jgi:quinoprotein glucose dehydrogenase